MMDDDLGPVVWGESSFTLRPSSTEITLVALDLGAAYSFGVDAVLAKRLLTARGPTRYELHLDHHGVMRSMHVPGVQLHIGDDLSARRCTLVSATAVTEEPPDVPESPAHLGLTGIDRTLAMMADSARRVDRSPLRELRFEQIRALSKKPYGGGP